MLLALSGGGKHLRAYSMKDGELLWERVAFTAAAPSADAAKEAALDAGIDLLPLNEDVDGDGADDVLVLARGRAQLWSTADGGVAWESDAAGEFGGGEIARMQRVVVATAAANEKVAIAIGVTEDDHRACAVEMNLKTGATLRKQCGGAGGLAPPGGPGAGAAGASLAVKSGGDNGDKVYALTTANDGAKLAVIDVAKLLQGKRGATTLSDAPAEVGGGFRGGVAAIRGGDGEADAAALAAGAATLLGDAGCALARLTDAGAVEIVRAWGVTTGAAGGGNACAAAVSPAATALAGVVVGAVVVDAKTNAASTSIISLETGAVVKTTPPVRGYAPADHGVVKRAWLSSTGAVFSTLVVTEDATLSAHGGAEEIRGERLWSRDESLALAGEVFFAKLPPPKSAAAAAADDLRVKPSFAERYKTQVLALKARFNQAKQEDIETLTALRRGRGAKLLPTRDLKGLRQQIIALAPSGAITSLHNGDGRVLWRRFLGGGTAGGGEYSYASIEKWRPTGDHAHDSEHALVLGVDERNDRTRAVVVDLYTGAIESDVVLPFATAHYLPLPSAAAAADSKTHEASAALLVDAAGASATVFPDTEEARVAAHVDRGIVSFFTVDQSANEIRGYALLPSSASAAEPKPSSAEASAFPSSYPVAQTWSSLFPPESGSIVGYASKPSDEVVHSWTRVLGDRSTLFKYLSPNVIFVAASPTTFDVAGAGDASSDASLASFVLVHLIDAATGRVLYRVKHPEARGPVHAVVCENWVVYHYYNTRGGRFAMSVLEMFDDAEHRKGLAVGELMRSSIFAGGNDTETISSFAPPPLRIMGQSYFVRPAATMMTSTYSMKGVTAHQVLMGTATDQVVALDKKFLDPRRPSRKPTAEDREEGLVPYQEVLPIFPQSWVTTRHQVARLRGIKTAPASLESTVLCVAHGLDFFYTRLHPSRSFDTLDDEFSYLLLIATLAALAVGAFVTHGMAYSKDLSRKWK